MYEWAAFLATASGVCAATGKPPPTPEEVGWVVRDHTRPNISIGGAGLRNYNLEIFVISAT